jgi:hypothetical protein
MADDKGLEIMELLRGVGKLYDENDLAKAFLNRGNAYSIDQWKNTAKL